MIGYVLHELTLISLRECPVEKALYRDHRAMSPVHCGESEREKQKSNWNLFLRLCHRLCSLRIVRVLLRFPKDEDRARRMTRTFSKSVMMGSEVLLEWSGWVKARWEWWRGLMVILWGSCLWLFGAVDLGEVEPMGGDMGEDMGGDVGGNVKLG